MSCFDQSIHLTALQQIQLRRLNRQLAYAAACSPFWRQRIPAGSLPLQHLSQLQALPFTTAADLRTAGTKMLCVPQRDIARIVTLRTSGTTAPGKRIFFTNMDLEQTVDFFTVGMARICGSLPRAAIFMPWHKNGVSDLLSRALHRLGIEVLLPGLVDSPERCAHLLRGQEVGTFIGLPSQMRLLALWAPELRPSRVLLSADYIPEQAVETIQRVWGCECFSHYGLTESGYGCAVDCSAHAGMHIRADALLLETIGPGGVPVPVGVEGEIVLTTLTRQAMPLIRYRTGDRGLIYTGRCSCGSEWPRLAQPRRILRERQPNIQQLDDLLLSCDAVLDYAPAWEGDVLVLSVYGKDSSACQCAQTLAAARWPNLQIQVYPGGVFPTDGRRKRRFLVP